MNEKPRITKLIKCDLSIIAEREILNIIGGENITNYDLKADEK